MVPYSSVGPGGPLTRLRQPLAPQLPKSLTSAKLPEDDLKDEGIYLSLEYMSADLAGRDVVSIEIDQCRYQNVNFGQCELDRAVISDSVFSQCDFANLHARDCSLTFESCGMDMASFRFATLKNVVFSDCKLARADFQEADLRGARFESCDLTGAQLSKAQMEGTRFADCSLAGINGVTSLRGAIVKSRDALALTYSLAGALGITIEDD